MFGRRRKSQRRSVTDTIHVTRVMRTRRGQRANVTKRSIVTAERRTLSWISNCSGGFLHKPIDIRRSDHDSPSVVRAPATTVGVRLTWVELLTRHGPAEAT